MKAPPRLQSLIEEGLIDTVVRQLMSGKEAMVYVVRCGDETRCAKIYKEANNRSFRQAVDYTENRKVKNSRSARAMAKGSKFGRQEQEAAWQSAEVDALYRLAAAGVRVPQPYNFHDGVLLMELVTDAHGDAAPRLNDVSFTPEDARTHHATLVAEVVRMLCAGVVHGDLSEFNVLLGAEGLHPTSKGARLRVTRGKLSITDGPFAETKEHLGGFYLVDVPDLDAAIELAQRIPDVRRGSVEIRPVAIYS